MSWLRSTFRRLRTVRLTALGYALLVLVTAFVFGAAPGLVDLTADQTLRQELAVTPPIAHDVQLSQIDSILPSASGPPLDPVTARGRGFEAQLPTPLGRVISGWATVADSPRWTVLAPLAEPATLTLRFQPGAEQRISYTSGRPPTGSTSTLHQPDSGDIPVFEGAVSEASAALLGVKLDDVIPMRLDQTDALARENDPTDDHWAVHIVGLFKPTAPADEFWYGENGILRPSIREFSPSFAINDVRVLMADEAYPAVIKSWPTPLILRNQWRGFVDSTRIPMADAGTVAAALRQTEAIFPKASTGLTGGRTLLTSNLATLLADARTRWSFALTMIASALVGPAALALISLALVAILAAKRRRPAVAAWRARGASTAQVLRATIGEGLLVAVPAGVLGAAVAIVVSPARDAVPAAVAAGIVLAAAVLAVGLLEIPPALVPRGGNARERETITPSPELEAAGGSTTRLALEILVVILAVAGIVVLRQRTGVDAAAAALPTTGIAVNVRALAGGPTINPLVAAAPTLGVIAAAILASRLIPILLRAAAWLGARARGVILALGLRRASRQGGSTSVVVVLFAGAAITVFSAAAMQSLDQGADTVAWQGIGADYRVHSVFGELPSSLDVGALPGVSAHVPLSQTSGVLARVQTFDVLAVSMPAYAPLLANAPLDPALPAAMLDAHPQLLPVILSTATASRMRMTDLTRPFSLVIEGQDVTAVVAGVRDWWPGLPVGGEFLVVSLDQLNAIAPAGVYRRTDELLQASASAKAGIVATLARYGSSVALDSRADMANVIRQRPISAAIAVSIRAGVIVGAAYAVLALVVGLVLVASARGREAGHLRLLGLGQRAPATLLAVEFGPVLAVALGLAVMLGLGLFLVVGHALGLGILLGSPLDVPLRLDPAAMAAVVAGVVALTAVAIVFAGAVGARGPAAAAMRAGLE